MRENTKRLSAVLALAAAFAGALLVALVAHGAAPEGAEAAGDPVLVGAGDIAGCSATGDEKTARLLDGIPGTVFTTGDNAYDKGTARQFRKCYDPSWGRHEARTRPVPGNHDYETSDAAPYYDYFGKNAGRPGRGYYSYDRGAWHVLALNSNVATGVGSRQYEWARADLARNPNACAVAYWHHPVFSSGEHGGSPKMTSMWRLLDGAGVDVVVAGHDHDYERFAPQTSAGRANPNGIRQFVVGTGGRYLRPFSSVEPNSEVRNSSTFGVLKLTLHASSYDWEFVPEPGKTFRDSGSAPCA